MYCSILYVISLPFCVITLFIIKNFKLNQNVWFPKFLSESAFVNN